MIYGLAAISIGVLGSLHCAGMCGPLLMAINRGQVSWKRELLHHSGRILVYMTLGATAGAIGASFSIMGLQQGFSLVIGALMILSVALIPAVRYFKQLEAKLSGVSVKFTSWIHQSKRSASSVRFLTGVANGLLPCGLVYMGIAGAANTFTPWDGALFMMFFGLGTVPTLAALLRVSTLVKVTTRNKIRKLIPVTVLVMGLLLMVRGMNLGVPYVSPQQNNQEGIAACE